MHYLANRDREIKPDLIAPLAAHDEGRKTQKSPWPQQFCRSFLKFS